METSWAERSITRVLNAVPGYRGYRDKEDRRDADRAVRDRLVAELTGRAERVERVAQQLAEARRISDVGPVNDFASSIRHLADRVNTTSYGYGGLFSQRDIDAAVLDQIRLFDESLFAGVEQVDGATSELERASSLGGDLRAASQTGLSVLNDFGARLDLRSRVVDTAEPATPAQMSSVLAVLKTPEELAEAAKPPAAWELHDRDAIAVLGDNYVVDARIDIESSSGAYRLFRIDLAPDKWLLVPRRKGEPFAVLTMTSATYSSGPESTIDGEAYRVDASGHGSGGVVGAGGETGRRPLNYTLLRGATSERQRAIVLRWGAEQQVLTGNDVHSDDVEIFGRPN
jgi:hypothetical protein